ncbi:hypothetical protein WJX73_008961 [Symbiochloris irregularis]|uniref:TLC domain-containing protein n=1 Tax=Symbiochloris irregularis TaxID=706552 RepID=A0AAW1NXF8_9CHLO
MVLEAERVSQVALQTVLWTILFFAFRWLIFRGRSSVFANRAVSLVHSVASFYLTALALDARHPFKNFGTRSTPAEVKALSLSLGYFLFDTVCTYLIERDGANLAHHLCSIAAVAVGVFEGTDGAELCACLILMEASNPFLHGRFFVKDLGYQGTTLSIWVDVLFALSFTICRLLLGPFVTFYTVVCPTASWIVKAGGAGIQIVSCVWFYKIVKV